MVNFDGVWELRIYYTVTTSEGPEVHKHTIDLNVTGDPAPGTDPADVMLAIPAGGTDDLSSFVLTTYIPLLQPCFNAQAEFNFCELWKIPEGTFDATFITALEIAEVGTNVAATQTAQQTTFTFRSLGGGNGRVQLMESAFSGNARQSPPFATTPANNLTNFVIGSSSPIVARDNTRFIARIAQNDGQNEKLWRKRFRE